MKHMHPQSSRRIFVLGIPTFYNAATLNYLFEDYSRYGYNFVSGRQISDGLLERIPPKLLIFPGGGHLPDHLDAKAKRSVRNYISSGGNIFLICASAYFGVAAAWEIEGGKDYYRNNKRKELLFPGLATIYNNDLGEKTMGEPGVRRGRTRSGEDIAEFFYGGPVLTNYLPPSTDGRLPHRLSDIKAFTPIIYMAHKDGSAIQGVFTAIARELPNGGAAAVFTNHSDHPFEVSLDVRSRAPGQVKKKIALGKATEADLAYEYDYNAKLEEIGRRLYPTSRAQQSARDFLYEGVFGLRK